MKKVLITGITGQDGSYLADILLEQGCEVHGLYRRVSGGNLHNIRHIVDKDEVEFHLHKGDITDPSSMARVIREVQPDELYHMADQDNVHWSYETPWFSSEVTAKSVGSILELVRVHARDCRVFIPCSATMFGDADAPQDERTPFKPRSPYAVAKTTAYYWAEYYREVHGLHIVTGIMYNHDSERRRGDYLLHKICRAAVSGEAIELGDPRQRVDIGYAKEYMEFVVRLMRLEESGVVAVGTGDAPTIGDMVSFSMKHANGYSVRWNHPDRPGKPANLIPCLAKLIYLLREVPKVSVYGVIDRLLGYYQRVKECESAR